MKPSVLAGLVLGLASACVCAAEQDDSFLSLFPPAEESARERSGSQPPAQQSTPLSLDQRARLFNAIVVKTQVCMFDAVEVLPRLGIASYTNPRDFLVQVCGAPMRGFLVTYEGFSEAAANALVVAYAYKALGPVSR